MLRFCASAGANTEMTMIRRSETRTRMMNFLSGLLCVTCASSAPLRWKKFYRRGAEERRDYAEESGFLVDVVDHAGVVVRQEKRVVAEIKNVCGAAVYLAQI